MARGTDPINDPRWAGQDSQSLPNRAAHPDPSRVAEFGNPEETPSHGIHGHLGAKHGLFSEADVQARQAQADEALRAELEADRQAAQQQSTAEKDPAKARLQGIEQSLKALGSSSRESSNEPVSLAEAVQRGDVVPSIEATAVEDTQDGKRGDSIAQNAPVAEKGK